MRKLFNATSRVAASFVLATAGLSLFAVNCSSDLGGQPLSSGGTFSTSMSGSAGTVTQGGSSSGATAGGITSAGTTSGGAATAGSAGSSAFGGSAGAGGAGTGGASGGASGTMQMDWITSDGLYKRLTSPIPGGVAHCLGNTPVVPGMPDASLLLQALKGKRTCMKVGGGMEMIGRMPDNCSTTGTNPRACLKDDQIKLVSDWISAGAPM
jgi:hypothetical protein